MAVTHQAGQGGTSLVASTTAAEPMDELEQLEWQIDPPGAGRVPGEATMPDAQAEAPEVAVPQDRQAGSGNPWATSVGLELATPADWLSSAGAPVGGGLAGRGRAARAALAGDGGTPQSEDAVERGLRWLAAHQRDDGGWSFNLQNGLCHGMCRNPGTVGSTTAATALALAPFLGAGYTHMEGEHREVVKRGLYYLVRRALLTPEGADLQEGTMYAQGLSAIVLCEAYAMTGDAGLREVAQKALDFIVYAQDQRGGGWRYTPGEPGDTTVTGWQLMALKSGQMARLNVPSPNIYLAQRFLDGVQTDGGAQYGYMTPEPRRTTTAIGLLCRMYGGWPRSHPGLAKGVKLLGQWGPSPDDIYYDYYATQVMRHWEGPEWSKWNPAMRDYLVKTQAREGHESGSWYFSGGHAESGGRLYVTAMAVMTLEVYYRYMPLYRAPAFEADRGGEHP